jgi:hypothetical protein
METYAINGALNIGVEKICYYAILADRYIVGVDEYSQH